MLACNFIKKRLQHRCFPVNIAKFFHRQVFTAVSRRCVQTEITQINIATLRKHLFNKFLQVFRIIPAVIYLFKVNSKNTRAMCDICSKLIIDTKTKSLTSFKFLYVNFEQISLIVLVFLLLTLNK